MLAWMGGSKRLLQAGRGRGRLRLPLAPTQAAAVLHRVHRVRGEEAGAAEAAQDSPSTPTSSESSRGQGSETASSQSCASEAEAERPAEAAPRHTGQGREPAQASKKRKRALETGAAASSEAQQLKKLSGGRPKPATQQVTGGSLDLAAISMDF